MGSEEKRRERRNSLLAGAAWAAGIGIALVEMQMGMDYVLGNLAQHASTMVRWLPMVGTLVLGFGGSPVPHYNSLDAMMGLLPMAAVPFGFFLLGLIRKDRAAV